MRLRYLGLIGAYVVADSGGRLFLSVEENENENEGLVLGFAIALVVIFDASSIVVSR